MNARFSSIIVCFALLACLALAQVYGQEAAASAEDCGKIDFGDHSYKPPVGKSWFEACQECCEQSHKDIGNFVGGSGKCQCFMKDPDFSI